MSSSSKPLIWIGSSLEDLRDFPDDVKDEIGWALYQAEIGGKHPGAKPLKGYRGASVPEIVEDHDTNTYRAVYTVEFAEAVYVLHCFMKKSTSGIKTPKQDINLIDRRYKVARRLHEEWLELQKKKR